MLIDLTPEQYATAVWAADQLHTMMIENKATWEESNDTLAKAESVSILNKWIIEVEDLQDALKKVKI